MHQVSCFQQCVIAKPESDWSQQYGNTLSHIIGRALVGYVSQLVEYISDVNYQRLSFKKMSILLSSVLQLCLHAGSPHTHMAVADRLHIQIHYFPRAPQQSFLMSHWTELSYIHLPPEPSMPRELGT